MAATTTLPVLFATGIHSARPAASAVGAGGLYSCTTHSLVYQTDASSWTTWANLAGTGSTTTVATDTIWTTSGKVAVATGTATATEQWPPGHEFDYAAATSTVTVSATTEDTATTVVTGGAVSYDGSTIIEIEFYTPFVYVNTNATGKGIYLYLYDGSASIGLLGYTANPTTTDLYLGPVVAKRRLTPSNASHTYSVRAAKDAGGTTVVQVNPGAGGHAANMPGFIRITKV